MRYETLEDRRLLAAGDLDTTFDFDGKLTTAFGSSDDAGQSVAIQADGKIVVAGYSNNGSNSDFAVARYNADGSLDTTFDGDGKVTTDLGLSNDLAQDVAVQADGKIVVAGSRVVGGSYDFALIRYNVDGSLDTSFDGDGILTTDFSGSQDEAITIAIQADGKIVVAGHSLVGARYEIAVVRYNTDGSLDTSFDGDGKLTTDIGTSDEYGNEVAIQANGKIVVAGHTKNGSNTDFALIRYNTDGSLDTGFDGDGKLTTSFGAGDDEPYSMAIQSDGKIVLGGISVNGSDFDFALARYNSNGSLDTSFSGDGKVTTSLGTSSDVISGLAIQPNGKIVAAGGNSTDFALVRYNADGSLDMSFDGDGIVTTDIGSPSDRAFSVALQSDGKIVAAGYSNNGSNSVFAVARYVGDPNIKVDANDHLLISRGNDDDHLRLSYDSGNGVILIEDLDGGPLTSTIGTGSGTSTIAIDPGDFTGDIIFDAGDGEDLLVVDGSLAAAGKEAQFNGGSDDDGLEITGGSVANGVVSLETALTSETADGSIDLDGFVVTINSVEAVDISGTVADELVFNFTGEPGLSADVWFLEDDGVTGNAISQLYDDYGLFAPIKFSNPTDALTINLAVDGVGLVINELPDFISSLTVDGGQSSYVDVFGAISLAADKDLMITASDVYLESSATVTTVGNGLVAMTTLGSLHFADGSGITTVGGDITLTANQYGIYIDGATISSTTGNILLEDTNYSSGLGRGIEILNGAIVGTGTTGTVTVEGTGGTSTANNNYGVYVSGSGTQITSGGGDVQVTGHGGGTGASGNNYGVFVEGGAVITAGGLGMVTVDGTGGAATGNRNCGVYVSGGGAQITSSGGDVTVTGQGGGAGVGGQNYGVYVTFGAVVDGGGSIIVQGIGGTTGSSNYGVHIDGGVIASAEDLEVRGQGGSSSSDGVVIDSISGVEVSAGGSVTIEGAGGTGFCDGVYLHGYVQIISTGGNIEIIGVEGGTGGIAIFLVNWLPITSGVEYEPGENNVITLTGDSMVPDGIIETFGGTVVVRNRTAGTPIRLGDRDAAGVLGLYDSELDKIMAGTILIGDATSGPLGVTSAITVTPAMELNVASVHLIANLTATGGLSGTATTVNVNPGSEIQDGIDVAASGTTVNVAAGTYSGNVNATAESIILAPGASPGQVTILGDLVLDSDDTLAIEIDGPDPASEFDNFIVEGEVTLGGASLGLSGSHTLMPGDEFTIIDNDGDIDDVGGAFAGLTEGTVVGLNNSALAVSYVGNDGNNVVFTVKLLGDYNGDGKVSAADYTVWRDTLGAPRTAYDGADGDGDGAVEQDDFGVWIDHYGESLPPEGSGAALGAGSEERGASTSTALADFGKLSLVEPVAADASQSEVHDTTVAAVTHPVTSQAKILPSPRRVAPGNHSESHWMARNDELLLAWLLVPAEEGRSAASDGRPLIDGEAVEDSENFGWAALDVAFETLGASRD